MKNTLKLLIGDEPSPELLKKCDPISEYLKNSPETIPDIVISIITGDDNELLAKVLSNCKDSSIKITRDMKETTKIINAAFKPLVIETIEAFDELYFDPNNPRTMSYTSGITPTSKLTNKTIQAEARKALDKPSGEIAESINRIGYQQGTPLKVVSLRGNGAPYIVLEGNTRLAAIKDLIEDPDFNSFNAEDVDIIELSGFNYDSAAPLKREMLKSIHISGVKEWSIYRKSRELQNSRNIVLKEHPDLDPTNDDDFDNIVKMISGGARLKRDAVRKQLNALDIIDRAISFCKDPVRNIDEYTMISEDQFEKDFAWFQDLLDKKNIMELIENDKDFADFMVWRGIFKKSNNEDDDDDSSNPNTHGHNNIAHNHVNSEINEMLGLSKPMPGLPGGQSPRETLLNIMRSNDDFEPTRRTFSHINKGIKILEFNEVLGKLKEFKQSDYDADSAKEALELLSKVKSELKTISDSLYSKAGINAQIPFDEILETLKSFRASAYDEESSHLAGIKINQILSEINCIVAQLNALFPSQE